MNTSRWGPTLLFAFALAEVSCTGGGGGGATAPKEIPAGPAPIVLVAIDGLRASDVGAFGGKGSATPNLDQIAGESAVFTNAFAQTTVPQAALASLLTGLYPGTTGVQTADQPLRPEAKTLAEALADKGYLSAAFVDGEGITSEMGFGQGFSSFESRPRAGVGQVGPAAVAWIRSHPKERFFVLVQSGAVNRAGSTADAAVQDVDRWAGDLMTALRDAGLDRTAVVAILGTEASRQGDPQSGPRLQPGLVHVPLMVRMPGGAQASKLDQIVEVVDTMPSLLELAEGTIPPNAQGRSFLAIVRGQGKPPYVAFGEAPDPGGERYVALGGYELIQPEPAKGLALYRLTDPPEEIQQPASAEEKRVKVMEDHLAAWSTLLAATSLDPAKAAKPLDEKSLEQLKSLGYVQ